MHRSPRAAHSSKTNEGRRWTCELGSCLLVESNTVEAMAHNTNMTELRLNNSNVQKPEGSIDSVHVPYVRCDACALGHLLAESLISNKTLQILDLQSNNLDSETITTIADARLTMSRLLSVVLFFWSGRRLGSSQRATCKSGNSTTRSVLAGQTLAGDTTVASVVCSDCRRACARQTEEALAHMLEKNTKLLKLGVCVQVERFTTCCA
eukprot:3562987-Amphidinium_carterae.1